MAVPVARHEDVLGAEQQLLKLRVAISAAEAKSRLDDFRYAAQQDLDEREAAVE